jgi:putative SOS response-associated peptidase YedK
LVLPRSAWDAWLDPSVGAEGASALLTTTPELMRFREVSSLVSNVNNDSPALLAPVD